MRRVISLASLVSCLRLWFLLQFLLQLQFHLRGRQACLRHRHQRVGILLGGPDQHHQWLGFYRQGHGGFVVVFQISGDVYLFSLFQSKILNFVSCIFTSVGCVLRRYLGTYSVGRGVAAFSSEAASSSSVSGLHRNTFLISP